MRRFNLIENQTNFCDKENETKESFCSSYFSKNVMENDRIAHTRKRSKKEIKIFFRQMNDPEFSYFCSGKMCTTFSKEPSRYQIHIQNLERDFKPKIVIVEKNGKVMNRRNDLISLKCVKLGNLNEIKRENEIKNEFDFDREKTLEFKFIGDKKEYPKIGLKMYICDEEETEWFEIITFNVNLNQTEKENQFWRREYNRSRRLKTYLREQKEKKVKKKKRKKQEQKKENLGENFPFCIFFKKTPDHNRVITLRAMPNNEENDQLITGKKRVRISL